MADASTQGTPPDIAPLRHWRGLGLWNLYFLVKLTLFSQGLLNLQALDNLAFACFLLLPLPPLWLHRLRHLVALPAGAALFYQDTWLPPFERLLAQSSQLAAFSPAYLLDLAGRLISWHWVLILFVLVVGYAFVSAWLRVTVPVVLALAWLSVAPWLTSATSAPELPPMATAPMRDAPRAPAADELPTAQSVAGPQTMDARLASFYAQETARRTSFTLGPPGGAPLDVLLINICSLSWDDMAVAGLAQHPLLDRLDLVFDRFNSATSYSGPASIRLLRASCGQSPHVALYEPVPEACYLFENLERLGYTSSLVLNHDGEFDDYLDQLQQGGGLAVTPMSHDGLEPVYRAFDGSPVFDDLATLLAWNRRQDAGDSPLTVLYNTVTLHDGSRLVGERGFADYAPRLKRLFDELIALFDHLEAKQRRVAVLIVPEHGAALRGDRMQFSGLREIPSPSITHVPVGVKLIGLGETAEDGPVHIPEPSSYLALSELVSRLVAGHENIRDRADWQALARGLPVTPHIAENEGVVVMEVQGEPFVRLAGESWAPYPQ